MRATKELGLTIRRQGRLQTWVASLISRDKSLVTQIVKGRATVSAAEARLIAIALGSDVSVLFEVADATRSGAPREAIA